MVNWTWNSKEQADYQRSTSVPVQYDAVPEPVYRCTLPSGKKSLMVSSHQDLVLCGCELRDGGFGGKDLQKFVKII